MDSDNMLVRTYKPFMLMTSKSMDEHKHINSIQHLILINEHRTIIAV